MMTLIQWLLKNKNVLIKAICGLSVACLMVCGAMLYKDNKQLSERLEMAYNNIESYEGLLTNKTEENKTLQLTAQDLKNSNDVLLMQLDSALSANKIKPTHVNTAATQTQTIYVNASKGVRGDLIELIKDSTYSDSIHYNDLTIVWYTIGKDTVDVKLDVNNTQYLAVFKNKEWKNKKNFFKRLYTLDFKKVWKHEYQIINTNDLIKTSDVRVVEITK